MPIKQNSSSFGIKSRFYKSLMVRNRNLTMFAMESVFQPQLYKSNTSKENSQVSEGCEHRSEAFSSSTEG